MGLGWAGFMSGLGQGMERASGAVDQYVAQKKLAQQLAMQEAQQAHMVAQDALAQKNYLAREASDKEKETDRRDQVKRQVINEDLMNMNTDQMPLASMPQDWQADARRFAPTQIAYQPPSMGMSNPDKGEVGPSEGGDYVNRFITPGERNNVRSMQQALTKAQMESASKDALINMNYSTRGDRTAELYYASEQRRLADEAKAKAQTTAQETTRKNRAGQFGFSQANTGYDRWLKDEWGPANPLTIEDLKKNPMSTNKYRPPSADQIAAKKLELFQNAIGAAGFAPSDYPDILAKMGVASGQDAAPAQGPQPPQIAPPMMQSHVTPPPMMVGHVQPGDPPPPAPWAGKFPNPAAAPLQAQGPKAISIQELQSIAPDLKARGVKADTPQDLLTYARSNGYTVTP